MDAPTEFFGWVLDEWKKGQKGVTEEKVREVRISNKENKQKFFKVRQILSTHHGEKESSEILGKNQKGL